MDSTMWNISGWRTIFWTQKRSNSSDSGLRERDCPEAEAIQIRLKVPLAAESGT